MDFGNLASRYITGSTHRTDAERWWQALCTSRLSDAKAFHSNIVQDELFEEFANVTRHLGSFAEGLNYFSVFASQPAKQYQEAINRTSSMVCAGPKSGSLDGVLCRIVNVHNVYVYLKAGHYRGARPKKGGLLDLKKLRGWARKLTRPSSYYKELGPDFVVRGKLPNAFWAPEDDIKSLGSNPTANRLREYLGLDPVSDAEPHIIFRLPVRNAPRMRVPTGWDAFDNRNFVPQPARPRPMFGSTKDLRTGNPGAREVVTAEVQVSATLPAKDV